MKKRFLILLLALSSKLYPFSTLPDEFTVTQRWLSLTLTFDIESNLDYIGSVQRKFLSLRTEYNFYDAQHALQAKAKARLISFGYVFDVVDALEQPLGRVEEYIFTLFPKFDIISNENQTLAVAEQNLWGTKFTLKDPVTQEELAQMTRPFIRFKDNWTVTITNPSLFKSKNIDPRLFITVMAFQTDADRSKGLSLSSNVDATVETSLNHETPTEEDFQRVALHAEDLLNHEDSSDKFAQILFNLSHHQDLSDKERKAASLMFQERFQLPY